MNYGIRYKCNDRTYFSEVFRCTRHFKAIDSLQLGPRGLTLLHGAVSSQMTVSRTADVCGFELCTFPCIETIKCLLVAGAHVNAS